MDQDQDFADDPLYKQVEEYISKPKPQLPDYKYVPPRRYLKKIILPILLFFVIGLPTGSIAFGFNYPKMIAKVLPDTSFLQKIIHVNFNGSVATPSAVPVAQVAAKPHELICKRFVSLDDALSNIKIACGVDLSSQGLQGVPAAILKLTKLNDLNLSHNNITGLPVELLTSLPTLYSLDLSNNQIATISSQIQSATASAKLQMLKLTGNPIGDVEKQLLKQMLPKTNIVY